MLANPHKVRRNSMSNNKDLLKEGTIRRFMKLAGTDVLSSDFLAEEKKLGNKKKSLKQKLHPKRVPPRVM